MTRTTSPGLAIAETLPATARVSWGGQSKEYLESGGSLYLTFGLALLIAAFLGIWIHERVSLWSTLFPAWFARLRTQLTSVAVIVLALLLTVSP